jgi:hypothetical protein
MRTLDELSHAPWECEQNGEDHVRVTVVELRHLLAIARAAENWQRKQTVVAFSWEGGLSNALIVARDAGMFGRKGGGR